MVSKLKTTIQLIYFHVYLISIQFGKRVQFTILYVTAKSKESNDRIKY